MWYKIQNKTSGVLDISIHGEIGYEADASEFIKELRAHDELSVVNLSIHSPGGSVSDGLAIYNALLSHPAKVYAHVEGIAASAASFILMAGDVITMPEDSFLMIHNAWSVAVGDADDMRKQADIIEKHQDMIVNIYAKRTGLAEKALKDMMADETWMNASEALELNFIDTISEKIGIAARIKEFKDKFKSLPVDINSEIDIEKIKSLKDFEAALRDLGATRKQATALASRANRGFQSDSVIDDAETVKLTDGFSNISAVLTRMQSLN